MSNVLICDFCGKTARATGEELKAMTISREFAPTLLQSTMTGVSLSLHACPDCLDDIVEALDGVIAKKMGDVTPESILSGSGPDKT